MSKPNKDDLEAVRSISAALEGFDLKDQERILRWAREKIGLPIISEKFTPIFPLRETPGPGVVPPIPSHDPTRIQDIRSFIQNKAPRTDAQFAAAVAYYSRFEAPEAQRKPAIAADDL